MKNNEQHVRGKSKPEGYAAAAAVTPAIATAAAGQPKKELEADNSRKR